MNIHPASLTDLENVMVWIKTKEECRTWAGPDISFPINRDCLIEEINFYSENSYVYKFDDNLLAFGQIIKKDNGYFHLARIITNSEFRGQGYGRKICSHLVSYASKLGGDVISLNVYSNNLTALRLYKSLGFKEQRDQSNEINTYMLKT
jgi:ribosomal protein S18 acetylase RimI-like enzyme